MSQQSFIKVYHYRDQRSDKVWAIDPSPNQDGNHRVWYGPRKGRLTERVISAFVDIKIREKLRKGYLEAVDLTIDTTNGTLVFVSDMIDSDATTEPLPTSLWYRFSKQSDPKSTSKLREILRTFLITTVANLASECEEALMELTSTPLYKNLHDAKLSGGVEYEEGPLAILLLFALRRFCNTKWIGNQETGDLIQIADDNNNLLPHQFEALAPYIKASSIERTPSYSPLNAITDIAIAMGCISAPVNLTALQTSTKAAFF